MVEGFPEHSIVVRGRAERLVPPDPLNLTLAVEGPLDE